MKSYVEKRNIYRYEILYGDRIGNSIVQYKGTETKEEEQNGNEEELRRKRTYGEEEVEYTWK